MSLEIELKLRVASHDPVRQRLRAAGATFIERVLERNTILDRPDAELRRTGRGLRLRTARRDSDGALRATLTAKGPIHPIGPFSSPTGPSPVGPGTVGPRTMVPGPVGPAFQPVGVSLKTREECEVVISDADAALGLLALLGYDPVLQFEKRRERWSLADCLIELDEPARLGLFVEIEGPDEDAIHRVRHQLALHDAAIVPETYPQLVSQYCDTLAITDRSLRFA